MGPKRKYRLDLPAEIPAGGLPLPSPRIQVRPRNTYKYEAALGKGQPGEEEAPEDSQFSTAQKTLSLRNRALEAAGNGIVISDALLPDRPVIYSNRAFTEITGYSAREIQGRNCRLLQGDDRQQPGLERIRRALNTGEACRELLRNYRKDGTLFWNDLSITPIADDQGKITHFIGVLNDVSDQVAAADYKDGIRKILESIAAYAPLSKTGQAICELLVAHTGSRAALISLKAQGGDELRALASFRLPEALKKAFDRIPLGAATSCPCNRAATEKREIITPDLSREPQRSENDMQLLQFGFRASWAFPILSPDRQLLGTCTLYGDRMGKPDPDTRGMIREALQLAALAVERRWNRDQLEAGKKQLQRYARELEENVEARTRQVLETVEELKKTNRSLQQQFESTREAENLAFASQALFMAMAKNFPKGVIMVFDQEHHFVHLEGEELRAMDLLSWQYANLGIDALPGFGEDQKRLLSERVAETLLGSHVSFEMEHGANTYVVNSTPLEFDNAIRWALLVFSNTTEQKKAERDLLRALHSEQELNDLKSRFISMASHEFRTPLSAILSSAILLGRMNEPGKEGKRERYIKQIKNNVRNMVVILNDFLSLGKLEEGDISFQASDFDFLELLRSVLGELEPSLKVGQHFVQVCDRADFNVRLDPKLTRHILVNLLSNAIKYSPENSAIHLRVSREGDELMLSVRDRGIGIPEDEQPNLFNRFFRARNAINIPGTGLGLHIVKQYTELMGGRIQFTSTTGRGSTFLIHLPCTLKTEKNETNPDH
ncbi:ATP-binding protein [Robiginitalea sp. SC105]|uniref:ATP-binding protein n=1 Tax=Robiginitalea sp. SC105 TaxID=2762332 RepID=UPI001639BC10|nr:ATP-binding protein [Robiginitalea sp. SC105]MBC2839568.1 PAS domain-containing protein [Robiginitalea sp. SC105]